MRIENRIKIALMSFYGSWIATSTITINEDETNTVNGRVFSYMIETADNLKKGVAVLNNKTLIEIIESK